MFFNSRACAQRVGVTLRTLPRSLLLLAAGYCVVLGCVCSAGVQMQRQTGEQCGAAAWPALGKFLWPFQWGMLLRSALKQVFSSHNCENSEKGCQSLTKECCYFSKNTVFTMKSPSFALIFSILSFLQIINSFSCYVKMNQNHSVIIKMCSQLGRKHEQTSLSTAT